MTTSREAHRAALVGMLILGGCSSDGGPTPEPPSELRSVEAPEMVACRPSLTDTDFEVDTLATGLDVPWRTAVAPDGRIFITERGGRILVLDPATRDHQVWARPEVFSGGEAGLLGLAIHPDFPDTGELFVVGTFPRSKGWRRALDRLKRGPGQTTAVNRVLRYRDTEAGGVLDGQVGEDLPSGVLHAGAELRFGPDRLLYVSLGDGTEPMSAATAADPRGKILRMDVLGEGGGSWDVYAEGFRNVQGYDWSPDDGQMFALDHGPSGLPHEGGRSDDDELNLVVQGGHHGWPWASGFQAFEGGVPPIWGWTPASAPGALAFGDGNPERRDLWIGHLKRQALSRIVLTPAGPLCEDWLFMGQFGRIRSITPDREGGLLLTTANRTGQIQPRMGDDLVLRIRRRGPGGAG